MINRPRVLVAEDDPALSLLYSKILGREFEVEQVDSIKSLKNISDEKAASLDLIIADLDLVDGPVDALLVDQDWRHKIAEIPILVVSGSDEYERIETTIHSGIKDYLTKPFNGNELMVKCHLSLKKPIQLNTTTMKATSCGHTTENLTPIEIKIVTYLLEQVNMESEKGGLIAHTWGDASSSNRHAVHISNLNKKLTAISYKVMFAKPNRYKLERM